MARFVRHVMVVNVRFWRETFWETWEPLPMDHKLSWILFVSNTVAVITLFEVFLLTP